MTKIAIHLILLMTISEILTTCPPNDSIKPCVCEDNSIYCTEQNIDINLELIFDKLNTSLTKPSKYFEKFVLSNNWIKQLTTNIFKEINFGEIYIKFCDNLTSIDKNAFKGTDLFTTKLEISENPKLISPDNSIFEALTNFVSIENIRLSELNLTQIPSKAFQSKSVEKIQNNLTHLYFAGKSFVKLGSDAFSSLNNLRVLSFEATNFNEIPKNAFAFKVASNVTLILDLSSNPLINSSIFGEHSLSNIERPTKLLFGSSKYPKQMTYLDEKVFLPFLSDNENNTIDLFGQSFDCKDCRNNWIRKDSNFLSKLIHLKCSDGRQFNDPDNYKNC